MKQKNHYLFLPWTLRLFTGAGSASDYAVFSNDSIEFAAAEMRTSVISMGGHQLSQEEKLQEGGEMEEDIKLEPLRLQATQTLSSWGSCRVTSSRCSQERGEVEQKAVSELDGEENVRLEPLPSLATQILYSWGSCRSTGYLRSQEGREVGQKAVSVIDVQEEDIMLEHLPLQASQLLCSWGSCSQERGEALSESGKAEQKMDLERELEEEGSDQDDFKEQIRILKHWKSRGNFVKAAIVALDVGEQHMLLGLISEAILLFDDVLNMFKEREEHDVKHGGISASVLDTIAAPELEHLIKLNVSKGNAYRTLSRPLDGAEAYQSALDVSRKYSC